MSVDPNAQVFRYGEGLVIARLVASDNGPQVSFEPAPATTRDRHSYPPLPKELRRLARRTRIARAVAEGDKARKVRPGPTPEAEAA